MKKTLLAVLLLGSMAAYADKPYVAQNAVVITDVAAIQRVPVYIFSDNYNQVTNNSDKPIWIMAYYNLCVDACGCDKHQWKVKVNPHGTWHDHWRPQLQCTFNQAGHYRAQGDAVVQGIDVDLHGERSEYSSIYVAPQF